MHRPYETVINTVVNLCNRLTPLEEYVKYPQNFEAQLFPGSVQGSWTGWWILRSNIIIHGFIICSSLREIKGNRQAVCLAGCAWLLLSFSPFPVSKPTAHLREIHSRNSEVRNNVTADGARWSEFLGFLHITHTFLRVRETPVVCVQATVAKEKTFEMSNRSDFLYNA